MMSEFVAGSDSIQQADAPTVVFGAPRAPGFWRVWLLLILPPILLATISMGYATIVVARAGGDTTVIGPAIARAIPYILMANHGVLFCLVLWFMKLDGFSRLRVGWPRRWLQASVGGEVFVGIIAGAVLFVIHQYGSSGFVYWLAGGSDSSRMAANSVPAGSNFILALTVGILLGGIVEEQLYRGYLLVRLTERMSLPVAMVPMLISFGLLHFGLGWTGALVATMTGLTLTMLFIWRRSLISVAIAHAMINILVLTL